MLFFFLLEHPEEENDTVLQGYENKYLTHDIEDMINEECGDVMDTLGYFKL